MERIRRMLPERWRFWRRRDRFAPQRRISRREREEQQRRLLYIAMATVASAVVLLLVGGALWEFAIRPRQALANVNGTTVTQGDYWKVRKYTLLQQIQQYQFFAAQNPQYRTYLTQLQSDLLKVKDAPTDAATLTGMVDDLVLQQRLASLGLAIHQADIESYVNEQFAPVPINTPTPTATVNPTAATWVAQTATSAAVTATVAAVNATATSVALTPTTRATPGTPGTPIATPATPGTPSVTPTVEGSATPSREEALATATVSYGQFQKNLGSSTGMNRDDYIRLVARPAIAKQLVTDKLAGQVTDVQPQVRAAHILLATKDGADQARSVVTGGSKSFEDVARQQSTDTNTAPNGGDLGWFPRGIMTKEFEDVAFATAPGQVSEPVQTKFGWHIIKVYEKQDARPLSEETLKTLKDTVFTKWLDDQRTTAKISTKLPATPTPPASQFEPPPGAPPTAVPTPVPTPTLPGSPVLPPTPAAATPKP